MGAQHTEGPWRVDGPTQCANHNLGLWAVEGRANVANDCTLADAHLIALSTVIPDLYASEINASIEWFWDGGFEVAIGDKMNGWRERGNCDTWVRALEWLQDAAIVAWPDSAFAIARVAKATGHD